MKRAMFCVLVVLVVGIISSRVLPAVPQEDWDKDNFGKVVGLLIDKVTRFPIEEKYSLSFLSHSIENPGSTSPSFKAETDNKGYFSITLPVDKYYIEFESLSENSKYCIEPHTFSKSWHQGNRFSVEVKRGQLTKVIKAFDRGGSLRIVLVDSSGNKIDFSQKSCEIGASFNSEIFWGPVNCARLSRDNLLDGELLINNILYPALYELKVNFGACGLGTIVKQGIKVNRNEAAVVEILVDFNDSTGVHGRLIDKNGIPIEGGKISVFSEKGRGYCVTDKSGFYKIVGLKESTYYLSVTINITNGVYVKSYGAVEIKEKILITKELTLNYPESD